MATNAVIEYRGVVTRLKPGHSAVLKCYKKKMLGSVRVSAEPCEDGGIVPAGVKEITENGEIDVSLYEKVNVQVLPHENVTVTPTTEDQVIKHNEAEHGIDTVTVKAIQTETRTVTENGTVLPEEGKYLERVDINVPVGTFPSGKSIFTENGEYDVSTVAEVEINVQPPLEAVTVTPTTEEQTVTPSAENYGLFLVKVEAIQTDGLSINRDNVTFDKYGNKFTGTYAPEDGRFFNGASLEIPLPADYIAPVGNFELSKNNTTYDVHKYATATVNLPLENKTVTPGEAEQTVTAGEGYEALESVKIGAIEIYEPKEVTSPEAIVTAPEGKYIKEVKVKVPTVTVYSGTAEPDASLGNDGDIYLLLEE